MSWMVRIADFIFPFVEPLSTEQIEKEKASLAADVLAIEVATWHPDGERALEEAQRIAAAEADRVRSAETKATTYLAVLAALVPV